MNLRRERFTLICNAGLASAILLWAALSFAQSSDKKDAKSNQSDTTKIRLVVTAGEKDAPVANASVYVRFDERGGLFHKQKKFELSLKTTQEGTVKVPDIPRGRVLIQVVAEGWKTFGQWYTLDKDEETIKIKLEKPPRWY